MAYRITSDCIACAACLPECPEECIDEGDPFYHIDATKCTDCGNCEAVCPTSACVPTDPSPRAELRGAQSDSE
jgi:NAD-dependent dihydropyrimidine dehydrogenase PreA subunit